MAFYAFALLLQQPSIEPYRAGLKEQLDRLSNFTCSVTIERSARKSSRSRFEAIDRVRLEVAYINRRETFSWPGGELFAEEDITRLVSGTIGNGDFAQHANAVLTASGSRFEAAEGGGRLTAEVPASASDWILRSAEGEVPAAYRLSAEFSAQTMSLTRLIVATAQLPRQLGFRSVSKVLEFRLASTGPGQAQLIPARAELHVVELGGAETRGESRFHDCRQYTAESRLVAGPEPGEPAPAARPVTTGELPADFEAELTLETPIDSDTAAVGDPVMARTIDRVSHRGGVGLPARTLLITRIARMELVDGKRHLELAALAFEPEGAGKLAVRGRVNEIGLLTERMAARAVRIGTPSTARQPDPNEKVSVTGPPRLKLPAGTRLVLRSMAR